MRTDTGQIVHLADYRPTDFVLERVDLTFELDPKNTKVEARLIFQRRESADRHAPLVLDGDELKLSSLLLDQVELPLVSSLSYLAISIGWIAHQADLTLDSAIATA